ncbi:class I SAM-dependent methyltransferase [Candidatus Woesearchaeota archaeon]|nr:class I SAM-dependent methyltransferase [Candidatus Woesearchaeota archaeon]
MLGEFFIIKRRISSLLKDKFSPDELILDIGCGERPYYHKNIGAKIICADIKQSKKTHFICDASSLPVKKSSFDGIVCVNSLYYYNDPLKSIKEFSNILKKSGKLIIVTPFIYPVHDIPDDKYRFTEFGIRELLKNEFTVKEIKTIGGIFNLKAVFLHSLIKGIPLLAPMGLKTIAKFFAVVLLYPFYILVQLLEPLDFLDKSRRWPTYYFTVAVKN